VVAVADPSLLINCMVGFDDNLLFIRGVVGLGRVVGRCLLLRIICLVHA
jgi:hypothetical protein